jgi:hypothetical protein
VRALTRLHLDDPQASRVLDAVIGILNPFIRSVADSLSVIPVYTLKNRPTASAESEGWLIRVKEPKSPGKVYVCLATSTGLYEWVLIASASA